MKRIHVNQHVIRSNKKNGLENAPITVKSGKKNIYGKSVSISGPSQVVYQPDKPLSCGARLWIETKSDVFVDGVQI